jgi:serine/threonine-protein kinase
VAEEFGPYLVYEQIGLGGMASVHRAEMQGIAGFRRSVALKRMLPHVAANEDLVRSFVREARLASHLRHANVAQTLELGKVGDIYFIAMELVPGKNLREVLSHCLRVCGPMPLPIAINIIGQIADALDYAHNLCDETGTPLGIIHRDVSPSNVIVSEGGVCKLIDFGIAKASAQSMQTMSRTIKGKFAYMAPEYIAGHIDARADLFALGVIAHELIANKPLFQGEDEMDTLHRVRTMPIPPPSQWRPNLPPEIDAIVMTALQRDPDQRWQGAHAMRTALTTEAQRLGLVAHGAQVDEWMRWAFEQKAGDFRVDTMPDISISNEPTAHTAETVTAPRPHPHVVHRSASPSSPPARSTSPVPRDEFDDDQRTIQKPPRRSNRMPAAAAEDARPTLVDGPRGRNTQRPTNQIAAAGAPTARPTNQIAAAGPPTERQPPTMPGLGAPAPIAPSGARTARRAAEPAPIEDVLADLDERSTVRPPAESAVSAAMTQIAPRAKRGGGLVLAILLLVAAAGTAAVVYFALPYFT